MVRITNPKGEEKMLSNEDFDKLLWRFIESETFKKWEIENNLIGSYMHYGKKMLNRIVVKIFLKEKGYKLEQNVKLKS